MSGKNRRDPRVRGFFILEHGDSKLLLEGVLKTAAAKADAADAANAGPCCDFEQEPAYPILMILALVGGPAQLMLRMLMMLITLLMLLMHHYAQDGHDAS